MSVVVHNTSVPPRVSVVMPVRDGERYLAAAIDSVTSQTLRDLEIIIVDDGSTDWTPQILYRLAGKDPRIQVIRQPAAGICAALEAGRAVARARYIARMDADDLALPHRLVTQATYLDRNAAIVAVGGQTQIISERGFRLERGRFPMQPAACRAYLRYGAPFCHPAVMMRSAALESCGGYRDCFEPAEDFDLWLRLSKCGDLANLGDDVLHYRVHTGAVTRRRARANARAASMALVAHVYGEDALPENWKTLHRSDTDWAAIEIELAHDIRLFARASYLRALILNGGITEPEAFSELVNSISELARSPQLASPRDLLPFMIVRTFHKTRQSAMLSEAMRILFLGIRYFPLRVSREVLSSVGARMLARHTVRASNSQDMLRPKSAVSSERVEGTMQPREEPKFARSAGQRPGQGWLSPKARLYLGHALTLIRGSKYGALMGGLVRVTRRASVRQGRRFIGSIKRSTLLRTVRHSSAIDAKSTRLLGDRIIVEKMSITFPGPIAPLLASIIIPCFNYGRFVHEAVESALNQTVQSLEVIVIDDGSTDPATHDAIRRLEHLQRVRVVRQENHGLPGARNTGIALAGGEYICCLDADDVIEPTYIEMATAVLESDRSAGFAYSWVQLFGEDSRVWRTRDFDFEEALIDNHVAVSAVFRRDDWIATGGYRPDMRLGYEDWDFWLRLAALGRRGRVIRTPLFNHRRHGRTMTFDAHAKRRRLIKMMREGNPAVFDSERLRKRIRWLIPALIPDKPLALFRRPGVFASPDARPHLLIIAPWLADGGGEILWLDLLADLKADWRISIVTTKADEQLLWCRFREITTDIVPLVGAFEEEHWRAIVDHVIVTRGTRAIASHGSAWAYENFCFVKQRHPRIVTIDILHNDLPSGHIRGAVAASASIDRHVAVSRRIAQSLQSYGVPADRITTILNGVDTDVMFGAGRYDRSEARLALDLPAVGFTLAWVGRLAEEKRPLQFLNIVTQLGHRTPTRGLLIGDGPLARTVDDQIQTLEGRVRRIAHVPRESIGKIYAAADFLLLTSSIEGLPFVALEALATGCPVAATDVGDIRSIVRHGENGFLVPPDRPADLADLLQELTGTELAAFRVKARQSIEHSQFNVSRMRAQYRELLKNLVASSESRHSAAASGLGGNDPVPSVDTPTSI